MTAFSGQRNPFAANVHPERNPESAAGPEYRDGGFGNRRAATDLFQVVGFQVGHGHGDGGEVIDQQGVDQAKFFAGAGRGNPAKDGFVRSASPSRTGPATANAPRAGFAWPGSRYANAARSKSGKSPTLNVLTSSGSPPWGHRPKRTLVPPMSAKSVSGRPAGGELMASWRPWPGSPGTGFATSRDLGDAGPQSSLPTALFARQAPCAEPVARLRRPPTGRRG